jgi:hypothetical protein
MENTRERGSAFVEFLLCFAFFLLPLLLGTVAVGLNIIESIEVTQVCRDAAHLFSYGIDFSSSSGQQMLTTLAPGIDLSSSGSGEIILSIVTYITSTDCVAAGYSSTCPNANKIVMTRRILVGNSNLFSSSFATPSSTIWNSSTGVVAIGDSNGNAGYLNDSSAVVSTSSSLSTPSVITLADGQYAYIAEMKVNTPGLSLWGPLGTTAVRAQFIF